METLVNINIGNAKSQILTTKLNNGQKVCTKEIPSTHNANVMYCIHNYVCVGNVVTIEVVKRGAKAVDTYYAAIRGLENTFRVKSDIINGSYVAVLLAAKLKVA